MEQICTTIWRNKALPGFGLEGKMFGFEELSSWKIWLNLGKVEGFGWLMRPVSWAPSNISMRRLLEHFHGTYHEMTPEEEQAKCMDRSILPDLLTNCVLFLLQIGRSALLRRNSLQVECRRRTWGARLLVFAGRSLSFQRPADRTIAQIC